jgi:small-conductance mechanosensitive channel/CRP-like cAMP-binding protein
VGGNEEAAAIVARLSGKWAVPILAALLVVVSALVNRCAPHHRHRLRRAVIVFAAFVVTLVVHEVLEVSHAFVWSARIKLWSDLFESFTIVHLATLAVFDALLPALSVAAVALTSDLVVAAGYIVSTLVVLRGAGLDLSSVVTTSAVVSGVLALSLQTTLGNVIGGVALQLDGSIHVNDWIQLENGKQGKVKEIRWRHTVVETRDWDTLIVPNAALLAQNITILGKRDGRSGPHRMWVYFNVDFRFAPSRVIDVVREALLAAPIERVADDPKPSVICYDLARDGKDSFGYYAVRYWLTDLAVDDPTSSVVRARIYAALTRAGIPLAHPTTSQVVQLHDPETDRQRIDRHRDERAAAIGSVKLFEMLTEQERQELAGHLHRAPYTQGETITRQGAVAHWLYLLLSGTADVKLMVDGESKVIAHLQAPGFFGEMGMMTGEPRSASVVATSDVECYRLDKEGFRTILTKRPQIADEVSGLLAHRNVELLAAREGLSEESKASQRHSMQAQIGGRIRDFFGLGDAS